MTVSVEEKTKHWLSERLPKSMVFSVLFVCFLPWVLVLAGVDFGSHDALSGAFIHTILEWSAFCVAVMTVVLAFVHYQMMKDIAIPIICVALFFSGMMDAFSVLAADRLIFNVDNPELISTIWSTGRIFNAFIMTLSVFFVMYRGWRYQRLPEQTLVLLLVAAAVTAFALTYYVYSLGVAFNVVDDGGFIVHPYDATALVLYLVCLTFLYPWLYKIHRSSFTYALILMAFVQIMAESYMVFGSDTVFDGYFNIAQFIKIIAYIVPFVALVLDYVGIHKSEKLHRLFISQQAYALEESNRELDEFAYIASHDLREPLRGVQSYAQFLQEDYDDKLDDEGRKMLASLVRLGERMQMLIDDLLTYSRVGRVALATQKCDLNKVVESVLELLSARLKMDNIEIRFDHDLPTVVCDKTRIHEVFMNFISNSIKYNDKTQRWIEIGCRKMKLEDENIGMREVTALYISDNGIGIPEKHQEKIFGIFKRLHAKNKFGGGTGSGLTIAKKIIERHNGRVWVSSKEDEGSTFYFILGGRALIDEHLILIVEDNDDDYSITIRALRKSGIKVMIKRCEDGDIALDYLYHRGVFECSKTAPRPDIILLDLNLPGTDGKEVLSILKADEKLMDIPVIVMTTSSDPMDIEKCYHYGANSYVQKPVGFDNYMVAIEQIKLFWLEVALTPKGGAVQ